jgi:hypothetical protein
MDLSKVSNEEMSDLVSKAFVEQVGSNVGIDEVEAECVRGTTSKDLKVELSIFGMAGSPSGSDWKDGKVKNASKLSVDIDRIGKAVFKLAPSETVNLDTNDYLIVYKLI